MKLTSTNINDNMKLQPSSTYTYRYKFDDKIEIELLRQLQNLTAEQFRDLEDTYRNMIIKSYGPVPLFEGLRYDGSGRLYVNNPMKFADDLKDKDDPEAEQQVLREAVGSPHSPLIEDIISRTRKELDKVEEFV